MDVTDMKKPGKDLLRYLAFSSLLLLAACQCDTKEPSGPADPRQKLTGIFEMRKLENGQTYLMKVETVGPLCNNSCDSLKYTNYGDLFNFTQVRTLSNIDSMLYIGIINPLIDKSGYRWKVSSNGNPYPPFLHNVIYNDSIKITFKMSNIQYYVADGIPFQDTVFTHVGVRIAEIE